MAQATRPNTTGSKTVTYVGTGPAGATIDGGLVKETSEPASAAIDQVKGKVLLQGSVFSSAVSHVVINNGCLSFDGKISSMNSNKQDDIVKPLKRGDGDATADITVARNVEKCVVTNHMTTNGISFV